MLNKAEQELLKPLAESLGLNLRQFVVQAVAEKAARYGIEMKVLSFEREATVYAIAKKHYVDKKKYTEIAEELGLSLSGVSLILNGKRYKALLEKAKRRLELENNHE